jgi:RNA polymerase sigma-70 factor (ECF subfamily)
LLEAMGEPSEAAILCAASESLRERVGSPLTPRERIERDALIDLVRDELGAGPFTAAWADGLSLKFEPAVERALSSLDRMEPDAKGGDRSVDLESTAVLLEEVRGGDPAATARLVKRYLPILRRWAHGRLPQKARDMADTDDLVQVALIRGLGRVPDFEQRRTGAFLAYMRQILRNQIRDEIRRLANKARPVELPEDLPDGGASPLEEAIARESMERYEAALDTLPQKQRDGVVMRLEMGFSYLEIAEALGSPSEEAARISVRRALERLRRQMPGSDPAQG